MTSLKNLANLSATQAAKALAQREIKAEDLLNDCLNQIGIREPEVHALQAHVSQFDLSNH